MKKTFKSKVDLRLLVPILLLLLAAEVFSIYYKIIIAIIAAAVLIAFVIYWSIATSYIVTDDNKLKIKSGFFFRQEIYIKSIKKVTPVKDHRTSPALSSDRLAISYNRYGRVIIAPTNKSEFIRELKQVNPRIRIEERK
jgi:hypothetical protein